MFKKLITNKFFCPYCSSHDKGKGILSLFKPHVNQTYRNIVIIHDIRIKACSRQRIAHLFIYTLVSRADNNYRTVKRIAGCSSLSIFSPDIEII